MSEVAPKTANPSSPDQPRFEQQVFEYRKSLEQLEQKTQEDYDKSVMALSGGAFGISMTFVKDIIGSNQIVGSWALASAWICWGVSVTATLSSFFFSQLALRKAIRQVDDRTIYMESPGGTYNLITAILNAAGGGLFLLGVIFLVIFVGANLQ